MLFTVEIEHLTANLKKKKELERNRQDRELTSKKINIFSKAKAVSCLEFTSSQSTPYIKYIFNIF